MIVFGGFERGVRCNTMIRFDFNNNQWDELEVLGGPEPQPRAGHSAIMYDEKMYIFGGKDEDNEKLKDFWCFDFLSSSWIQKECDEG